MLNVAPLGVWILLIKGTRPPPFPGSVGIRCVPCFSTFFQHRLGAPIFSDFGAQDRPRRRQDGPRGGQDGPRCLKDRPKLEPESIIFGVRFWIQCWDRFLLENNLNNPPSESNRNVINTFGRVPFLILSASSMYDRC